MDTAIKTVLARKNSEMEKLEQSKKSHLRMITSSTARLKLKLKKTEDHRNTAGEIEAKNIRMYETHNPGFCYLRNGEYRKQTSSSSVATNPDPAQCSEKIKAILFTDNELDVYKTMCLHLLGTHIEDKNHIQRKDGRLCSYVKAQAVGNSPNTMQSMSQKGNQMNGTPSKYDKMLPRYILDVKMLQLGVSKSSIKTFDWDSGSDDESKRKRKLLVLKKTGFVSLAGIVKRIRETARLLTKTYVTVIQSVGKLLMGTQIPIYINNEIRMIVNSVLEALEAVESYKLKQLTELASSPEELRNMLAREDIQEFIFDLARNPLVMKPTSYVYVMAHLMFDTIPEKGTLETVAQVLEVYDDSGLKKYLNRIRRGIFIKHLELTNSNTMPQKKSSVHKNPFMVDNSKSSILSVYTNLKSINNPSLAGIIRQDTEENITLGKKDKKESVDTYSSLEKENMSDNNNKKIKEPKESKSVSIYSEKITENESAEENEETSDDESYRQRRSVESSKCDLHSLTNPQRILLGLKVASLKSRPINMHQFEGKKKVDLSAIINPIVRPQVSDINYKQNSPENRLRNFALPENTVKKSVSKITISTTDLENLTRTLLTNLRLEISETENKKRVSAFMSSM